MVKPDIKHNYYADLDLPASASVDDVRKAYRKLALQYHPDRNAGNEGECVPRFQAIQAANEILSDPTVKARYDQDRRKATVFPTVSRGAATTSGSPFQANTAYPPPPRRTQPGTWQRPTSSYAPAPKGADRFTNFPKPSNTPPRNGPAQDRQQQFRAWQHINTRGTGNAYGGAANRRPFGEEPSQAPRPPPPPPPPRSPNPPMSSTSRPRSQRQDTNMPSEEQIRAGMRHGTSGATEANASETQTAWEAFNNINTGKQGMPRRRPPPATPKRPGGFDPSAPGSDERPAPPATGQYGQRHHSEDLGREGYPPPPPGPPPTSEPQSPLSSQPPPQRPTMYRPKSRTIDDNVPYAEGNRVSTPYASYIGEKTKFSSEGLRRSNSTRDSAQQNPADSPHLSPIRSHSAGRWQQPTDDFAEARSPNPDKRNGSSENSTDGSSDVSSEGPGLTRTPEETDTAANSGRPSTAPTTTGTSRPTPNRPMKKPTAPSSRLNGFRAPTNPQSPPRTNDNSQPRAQSEEDRPDVQQRASGTNMYDTSFFRPMNNFSAFNRKKWIADSFGSFKASSRQSKASIPFWAVPSSLLASAPPETVDQGFESLSGSSGMSLQEVEILENDPAWINASTELRKAYCILRTRFKQCIGSVEELNRLNMRHFLTLVEHFNLGGSLGCSDTFDIVRDLSIQFPSLIVDVQALLKLADTSLMGNRFDFPSNPSFNPTSGKSRSSEDINTQFDQQEFNGTFQGTPDYFSTNARRTSSNHRRPSRRGNVRSATADGTPTTTPGDMGPPPRPGEGQYPVKFSEDQWKQTFKDASWTWTGASSKPTSRTSSRQNSRLQSQTSLPSLSKAGTKEQPFVVDDDVSQVHNFERPQDTYTPIVDEGDAMDIDTPPHQDPTEKADAVPVPNMKEPRLYSVPRSPWRQQQEKQHTKHTTIPDEEATEDPNLQANLDDLAHVEPFAKSTEGLQNLADISSTLPFSSAADPSHPTQSFEPEKLALPAMPKVPDVPVKLTKTSWHNYALYFGVYLQHFHTFNKTMLAHFEARQKRAEALLLKSSQWLEAAGDTSDELGFGNYCKGAREDERVRETWIVGCEKHLEAVNAFHKLREHVRKLVTNGALVDA